MSLRWLKNKERKRLEWEDVHKNISRSNGYKLCQNVFLKGTFVCQSDYSNKPGEKVLVFFEDTGLFEKIVFS